MPMSVPDAQRMKIVLIIPLGKNVKMMEVVFSAWPMMNVSQHKRQIVMPMSVPYAQLMKIVLILLKDKCVRLEMENV